MADVFVSITDPRQAGKVEHGLVELLVVAVNAVLAGADTFVEIELWAKETSRRSGKVNAMPLHLVSAVCRRCRLGAAGNSGEIEREDGDSRTAG